MQQAKKSAEGQRLEEQRIEQLELEERKFYVNRSLVCLSFRLADLKLACPRWQMVCCNPMGILPISFLQPFLPCRTTWGDDY